MNYGCTSISRIRRSCGTLLLLQKGAVTWPPSVFLYVDYPRPSRPNDKGTDVNTRFPSRWVIFLRSCVDRDTHSTGLVTKGKKSPGFKGRFGNEGGREDKSVISWTIKCIAQPTTSICLSWVFGTGTSCLVSIALTTTGRVVKSNLGGWWYWGSGMENCPNPYNVS